MKEGGGGDYLYVAWKTPTNSSAWNVIPGEFLGDSTSASGSTLTVQQQPTNTTAVSGQTATFSVSVTGSSSITTNVSYQWQLNGLDIPGAVSRTYTTPFLFETNSGRVYRVILSIPGLGQYSSNAMLTVLPDTVRPTVVAAMSQGMTNVQLTFSEPLEAVSATNIANYVFSNGVTVIKAVLTGNATTVTLTTGPLTFGSNYTIIINGVRDGAAIPNTITANTLANFIATEYTLVDIGGSVPAGGAAMLCQRL